MDQFTEQNSPETTTNYGDLLRSLTIEGKALVEQYKELFQLEAKRFFGDLKESLVLGVVGGISAIFGAFFLVLGLCQGLASLLNIAPWFVYLGVGVLVVAAGLFCINAAIKKAPSGKKSSRSQVKHSYGLPN